MTQILAKTGRRVTWALRERVSSKMPVIRRNQDPYVQGEKMDPGDRDIIYPSREIPAEYRVVSRPPVKSGKRPKKGKDPVKIWRSMGRTSDKILRDWGGKRSRSSYSSSGCACRSRRTPGSHVMRSHRGFVRAGKQTTQAYWEI
jgi:hypothetical protein